MLPTVTTRVTEAYQQYVTQCIKNGAGKKTKNRKDVTNMSTLFTKQQ